MLRLAVIIVNFNGGTLLQRCLGALEQQTVAPARVIVADNGSTDGSIGACRSRFPWAEYHLFGDNLGFARANNLAVAMVDDCEWVALLNPDAFADPGWHAAFQRHAASRADIDAFASCMVQASDPTRIDGAGDVYRVDGLAWCRAQGLPVTSLSPEPQEVFAPSAGAGFYRRAAFVEAGGFCERYFCYYEDVDLGFRLRLLGRRCWFLPDAVVHHVGSALTGTGSAFSVFHVHRNFVWTYVRNMPGRQMWIHLPAHILANIASVAVFIRKGQGRTIVLAKAHAILGLPTTLRERRHIQRTRRVDGASVVSLMQRGNLVKSLSRRVKERLRRPPVRPGSGH